MQNRCSGLMLRYIPGAHVCYFCVAGSLLTRKLVLRGSPVWKLLFRAWQRLAFPLSMRRPSSA